MGGCLSRRGLGQYAALGSRVDVCLPHSQKVALERNLELPGIETVAAVAASTTTMTTTTTTSTTTTVAMVASANILTQQPISSLEEPEVAHTLQQPPSSSQDFVLVPEPVVAHISPQHSGSSQDPPSEDDDWQFVGDLHELD